MTITTNYFQAASTTIYLQLNQAACDAKEGFAVEGPDHPRCRINKLATAGVVALSTSLEVPENPSIGDYVRHGIEHTALLVDSFHGDFSLYVYPFEMCWPNLADEGALASRMNTLEMLAESDYRQLMTEALRVVGLSADEKKSSE